MVSGDMSHWLMGSADGSKFRGSSQRRQGEQSHSVGKRAQQGRGMARARKNAPDMMSAAAALAAVHKDPTRLQQPACVWIP